MAKKKTTTKKATRATKGAYVDKDKKKPAKKAAAKKAVKKVAKKKATKKAKPAVAPKEVAEVMSPADLFSDHEDTMLGELDLYDAGLSDSSDEEDDAPYF